MTFKVLEPRGIILEQDIMRALGNYLISFLFCFMRELISKPLLSWCVFRFCVAAGKVYVGNKQEIAENRIPELNTYMKVRFMLIVDPLDFLLFLMVISGFHSNTGESSKNILPII